jgi:hypothetical protein
VARLPIEDQGSDGDLDLRILARSPGLALAASWVTAFCAVVPAKAQVEEGIEVRAGNDDDVASLASIASIRAPAGHVCLSPEALPSRATVTGRGIDPTLIDELHGLRLPGT